MKFVTQTEREREERVRGKNDVNSVLLVTCSARKPLGSIIDLPVKLLEQYKDYMRYYFASLPHCV